MKKILQGSLLHAITQPDLYSTILGRGLFSNSHTRWREYWRVVSWQLNAMAPKWHNLVTYQGTKSIIFWCVQGGESQVKTSRKFIFHRIDQREPSGTWGRGGWGRGLKSCACGYHSMEVQINLFNFHNNSMSIMS